LVFTVWSAKVEANSICLSVNGRTTERSSTSTAEAGRQLRHEADTEVVLYAGQAT
jgi:hypothetical protein